jgi:uncharacterized protein (DUF1778 family)
LDETKLFDEPEAKTETITIRLTKKQRERINLMARNNRLNISKFVFALIAQENKRQIDKGILDLWDDGMPW